MKKLILTVVAALATVFGMSAREAGYRGFVDVGYAFSTSKLEVTDGWNTYTTDISNRLMVSTTHGYQIMPYVFVGAGVGMTYWHEADDSSIGIPIFADIRADILPDSRFCPFVDAKIGYSVCDIEGLYFNPQVGFRFGLTETIGINLGVGIQMQKVKDIDGSCNAVTLKLGLDF